MVYMFLFYLMKGVNTSVSIHDGPTSLDEARTLRTLDDFLLFQVSDGDYMRIHGNIPEGLNIRVAVDTTDANARCKWLISLQHYAFCIHSFIHSMISDNTFIISLHNTFIIYMLCTVMYA